MTWNKAFFLLFHHQTSSNIQLRVELWHFHRGNLLLFVFHGLGNLIEKTEHAAMKNVCHNDNNNNNENNENDDNSNIIRCLWYCKFRYGVKIFYAHYTVCLGLRNCPNKAATIEMIRQKKKSISKQAAHNVDKQTNSPLQIKVLHVLSHLSPIRFSLSTKKNVHLWKLPSSVKLCTDIILHSEVRHSTVGGRRNERYWLEGDFKWQYTQISVGDLNMSPMTDWAFVTFLTCCELNIY